MTWPHSHPKYSGDSIPFDMVIVGAIAPNSPCGLGYTV